MGNVDTGVYRHTPDWKIPLTDKGKSQASDMADKLIDIIRGQIDLLEKKSKPYFSFPSQETMEKVAVYCSPWLRARQTAQPILDRLDVFKYYEDPRLREQEWGNFREEELAAKIERERYKFGTFFYRMPYGESGADVYDRISTFLETLYRDFKKRESPQNIVIVSHGLTIRVFLMRWFHWLAEEFDTYKTPKNCEILLMQRESRGEKYKLLTPLRKRPYVENK